MSDNVDAEIRAVARGVSALEDSVTRMTEVLEQISDGLFYLNLHVGAEVTPWVPDRQQEIESDVPTGHTTGSVKWFSTEEGFGFIEPDGGGTDVFLHVAALLDRATSPRAGQRVEFGVTPGPRGPMAENVRLTSS